MRFAKASEVEQICYEFKLADYPRGLDRALVNDLFNGVPPYTKQEEEENGIVINVNFLEGTRIAHDARLQITGNLTKPGRFFSARTDLGPKHRRTERSAIVTSQLAKIMKRSPIYFETFRSKLALDVLHGIGPSAWDREDFWCPDGMGIEDVLIPANTLLTMKNLPFFALYHSYTGPELMKMTRDRKVATGAGWNMDLVDKCIEYIDAEATSLMGTNWPEVWSPEKMAERVKGDGGFYAGDQVPTIDCFDFYFWDDEDKEEGWKRRIILDSWSTPSGMGQPMGWNSKVDFARNQFLFSSGSRKVASCWREIVTFQFADLSAVAPFRYHSVRSIGYLLYAVCNLQNRLRCKFSESVFESLMMYFRVKSGDDAERALKIELANRGFIDESVQFIPAAERFQVNANLVELLLNSHQEIITQNTSSYVQNTASGGKDRTEKTKFQVMAEIQAMNAMIASGLQQAYRYQEFEYHEIFRRFMLKHSRDPDVKEFRSNCLARGVPESMLSVEAWELEPERVLGAGNKTLEMAIAEQLMQFRSLYDPEPQRQILRMATFATTNDPGMTDLLVPDKPEKVTDSVHDAELATGTLMMGLPVELKTGMNHIEYVNTMLKGLALVIQKAQKKGGMATQDEIAGMGNLAQHIEQHIKLVEQDEHEKARVKKWNDALKQMMNLVKAFAQRLQEQMKKQQEAQGQGTDPKDIAKVKAIELMGQTKAKIASQSHAQKTAQRQLQWEMEQKREEQGKQSEQAQAHQERVMDVRAEHAKTSMGLQADRVKTRLDLSKQRAEHRMELERHREESKIDLENAKKLAKVKPKTAKKEK
jgi:hypothetical protein